MAADPQGLLLTVVDSNDERKVVRVDRSPFRIGRLPDRDLSLRDSRISRNHAQILLEDGRYFVEDSGSRHGVFVNGRKVSRAPLRPRDQLDFGIDDSFRILVGDEHSPAAPLLKKVAEIPSLEGTGDLGRLSAVIDVARVLESSGSLDDVLAAAVDAALSVTGAERGFLLLQDSGGELQTRIARDQTGSPLPADDLKVPHDVIAGALKRRHEMFAMTFDPAAGPQAGQSGPAPERRSVLCVPLVKMRFGDHGETSVLSAAENTIGALYMDSSQVGTDLGEGHKELLQTLAIEISTVLENARLLGEEQRRRHLEQELQIAREIQQSLLPNKLPTEGWLRAAGSSDACFQVGGDYFDVMELPPDHWGAVLVDVSGKGVSAALLTSLLQGAFFQATAAHEGLAESLARINRYVCERSRHARFATAFCCVISEAGRVRWINAGHCATVVAHADGTLDWLKPTGFPIGLFPDAEFPEESLELQQGDKIVIYSDGVSEAANHGSDRFGEERIANFVQRNRALRADRLHVALLEEVAAFTQGAEQEDDLTLLVLGYGRTGQSEPAV